MKKYELFSKEQLAQMCQESFSYREVATKIGYNPDGGSGIRAIKDMIIEYDLDVSHFTGQSHQKNTGSFRVPISEYLDNKRKIQTHALRLRLIAEGIFKKECSCCHNTEWLGQEIPLELHHKDGNKDNNNLDNLSLLCPNCHYFTETYKVKNWKK